MLLAGQDVTGLTPQRLLGLGLAHVLQGFARALMLEPAVVLLDEPSMGLDPRNTRIVFDRIDLMRRTGVAVLLVEQNARRALEMADVGCVLDLGRVHISGPARELAADPRLGRLYLGGAPAT
ncbi:hypothetical protein ABGB18_10135 [Nonomuraea sp. B12E4]